MSILMYVLAGLAVVIAIVLILAALKPNEFRVTRSAAMAASPRAVFERINDFHNWEAWSPWAKLDPNATNEFAGAASGPGAIFAWSGNNKVGQGKMTILESRSGELVKIKLEFLRPMRCTNTAEFSLKSESGGARVVWTMYGPNLFMGKVFGLFMNMDAMVGRDFEKGLANLKSLVEGQG